MPPDRCLIVEDSHAGVEAELASGLLPSDWIARDPADLMAVVERVLQEARSDGWSAGPRVPPRRTGQAS